MAFAPLKSQLVDLAFCLPLPLCPTYSTMWFLLWEACWRSTVPAASAQSVILSSTGGFTRSSGIHIIDASAFSFAFICFQFLFSRHSIVLLSPSSPASPLQQCQIKNPSHCRSRKKPLKKVGGMALMFLNSKTASHRPIKG